MGDQYGYSTGQAQPTAQSYGGTYQTNAQQSSYSTGNPQAQWNQPPPATAGFAQPATDHYQGYGQPKYGSNPQQQASSNQYAGYGSYNNGNGAQTGQQQSYACAAPVPQADGDSYGNGANKYGGARSNSYDRSSGQNNSYNNRGGPGNNRNSGPGFNKGPRPGGYNANNSTGGGSYGGSSSNNSMQEIHDTIFVSGLPEEATEDQLHDHFGSIGLIKQDKKTGKDKIWIYRDKVTGKSKGEATITYADPPTANSAINWFHDKDFLGAKIKVEIAQRRVPDFLRNAMNSSNQRGGAGSGGGGYQQRGPSGGGGGYGGDRSGRSDYGGGRGGQDGGGQSGGSGRDGDWRCPSPSCNNNNFAWRTTCNRCQTERPEDAACGGGGSGSGSGGFRRDSGGRDSGRGYPNSGGSGGFRQGGSGGSAGYRNAGGPNQRGAPPGGSPRGGGGYGNNGPRGGDSRGPGGANDYRRNAPPSGAGGRNSCGPMRGPDARRPAPY